MFDREIVGKKIPFSKNFGLRKFLVQDRVQDKVGLAKFSPIFFFFFFAKSLEISSALFLFVSDLSMLIITKLSI